MSKYVDWTDTYKQDKQQGIEGTISRPIRTELPQRGKKPATMSASNRRRSATDTKRNTGNTTHNQEVHTMPVKTTRNTAAKKTTTRRTAKAEPEALVLSVAKLPKGRGGILYNDADNHGDEKLNVTSMYLSQDAVAKMFGGEIPETLTISAA